MTSPFDRPISRRKALAGAGSVGLGALLAACGADDGGSTSTEVSTTEGTTATVQPSSGKDLTALFGEDSSCTLSAEQTEGPYYFDADSIRTDITEGRPGIPLRLAVRVREAGSCEPLRNAVVDIWHWDVRGAYSGFDEKGKFLRGAQVTDADGIVQFQTIYPGWYEGRTIHIHAKVHLDNTTALTTQIYFDDALSDQVLALEPYNERGERETRNDGDFIFEDSLVAALKPEGEGYVGAISFDVA